jgi:UDP-2,4-diacetamido-2,4,6-trideoxy-beta-L-altropyranose hydrolase
MGEELVLIRADSSTNMGIGHISRCMGLAQAFIHHDMQAVFVSKSLSGDIIDQIQRKGYRVLESPDDDISFMVNLVKRLRPKWMVLDHPELALDYEKNLMSSTGVPLAVIDGQYRQHVCELLLNPNVYATVKNCVSTVPDGCRILAGYSYYILRDEYLGRREIRAHDTAFRILVTLGGADPHNVTLTVCRALETLPTTEINLTFDIVLGPANQHAAEIRSYLASVEDKRFRLYEQPSDLFSLISRCSLCVSAGGITMGEVAYLEKPAIGLVVADNQRRTVETLAAKGAIVAGELSRMGEQVLKIVSDPGAREYLVSNIRGLVDGKGKDRVVEAMRKELNLGSQPL